eukprot:1154896-Pelagomonas_calceolata.AAC.1
MQVPRQPDGFAHIVVKRQSKECLDLNVSLTSIPNQARCNSSCPDAILVKLLAVLTTANDPIPPQIGYYAGYAYWPYPEKRNVMQLADGRKRSLKKGSKSPPVS